MASQWVATTMFKISNLIVILMLTYSTALTLSAHVILLLRQCGPNIITLGHRAPSCGILVRHIGTYQKSLSQSLAQLKKTLTQTLIFK